MQKLHLVGFTTEHDGLVFSARKGSKAGGYIVPLDGELLSTIAEAERLRNGKKAKQGDEQGARPRRADSRLTPREIQAHLRTGRSIPEVAAEAGVDVEWVERFAVPIVAEQAQMVERARAMTYSKARLGQSTQPLGISVRWNLADKGVAISEEAFDEGWSAFQLQDEVWMIRFRYTSRARLQVAEWELDLGRNQLTSRNRLASELGYVEKGRRPPAIPAPPPRVVAAPPVRVVEEVVEEAAAEPEPEPEEVPAPRRRKPARRSRRAARKKTAPRKKTAVRKKSPAKKRAPTKKAPARAKKTPAVKKRTTARKAPSKTAAVKKATRRAPRRKAPAKTVAARRPAKKTARPTPRPAPAAVEAPTPAPRPAPSKRAPAPRRASQAGRPRIAAASAKDAASKRSRPVRARTQSGARPSARPARPARRRAQPARAQRQARKTTSTSNATTPNLSGPLARSLLARRLMARKAAQGNGGGKQAQRPLRVR